MFLLAAYQETCAYKNLSEIWTCTDPSQETRTHRRSPSRSQKCLRFNLELRITGQLGASKTGRHDAQSGQLAMLRAKEWAYGIDRDGGVNRFNANPTSPTLDQAISIVKSVTAWKPGGSGERMYGQRRRQQGASEECRQS